MTIPDVNDKELPSSYLQHLVPGTPKTPLEKSRKRQKHDLLCNHQQKIHKRSFTLQKIAKCRLREQLSSNRMLHQSNNTKIAMSWAPE